MESYTVLVSIYGHVGMLIRGTETEFEYCQFESRISVLASVATCIQKCTFIIPYKESSRAACKKTSLTSGINCVSVTFLFACFI